MKLRTLFAIMLLAASVLLPTAARSQQHTTKSGTPIAPADRIPASLQDSKHRPLLPDPTAGTYVAVTRDDLLGPLAPLLQWKREQGYRVETIVVGTRNSDSIRAALQRRYDNATATHPPQRYVLLVGDIDRLQSCQGRHAPAGLENHVTDLYYGEYSGDYLPEAWVGRLSVADSAELAAVVAKTIAYEQGRWATAGRVLLAAGDESRDNAPITTNGQVNYLSGQVAALRPDLDTVCFRNPHSGQQLDSLVKALDDANLLVNYTAHCTRSGWNNPTVTHATLDSLPSMTPTVWVNNCCLSNAFNTTCFGERLLRMPHGGAVAVVGATNETLWNEDFYWAVGAQHPPSLHPVPSGRPGAFDRLFEQSPADHAATTIGAMNAAGCRAVSLSGSPYDAFYWETYCLLGDPSLVPMMGGGDSLPLTWDSSPMGGMTCLGVHCLPYSRISATQDGMLLGTVMADSNGHGTLLLAHGLTGDSITLTATLPDHIFHQKRLPIATPYEGRLAITEASLSSDGTNLSLLLRNVGGRTASRHRLAVCQNSDDKQLGAAMNTDTLWAEIPPLDCGSDTLLTLPLGTLSMGQSPFLKGQLILFDSAATAYAMLPFVLDLADCRPQLARILLLDSRQNPLRKIIPGDEVSIHADLTHAADSIQLCINGIPVATGGNTDFLSAAYATDDNTERLHLELTVRKDRWQKQYGGWLLVHNNMEDFESGDLSNFPWQATNLYPWQTDSGIAHQGHFCVRSAPIDHAQRSTLSLEIETLADDSVSFFYHVSSESHDRLYFYVDGRRSSYWGGNGGWQYFARALPAGKHTLQWVYQKDATGSEHNDCAYLDDIRLPLALWSRPCGRAVADSTAVGFDMPHNAAETPLSLHPNPTNGTVTIRHNASPHIRTLTVHDALGQQQDRITVKDNCGSTQYSTRRLRFGIYTLTLHDKAGKQVQKLIVTK